MTPEYTMAGSCGLSLTSPRVYSVISAGLLKRIQTALGSIEKNAQGNRGIHFQLSLLMEGSRFFEAQQDTILSWH